VLLVGRIAAEEKADDGRVSKELLETIAYDVETFSKKVEEIALLVDRIASGEIFCDGIASEAVGDTALEDCSKDVLDKLVGEFSGA
jgi:hypothetical protein